MWSQKQSENITNPTHSTIMWDCLYDTSHVNVVHYGLKSTFYVPTAIEHSWFSMKDYEFKGTGK